MGITYHLIMGDHSYVEHQGGFLSYRSLQHDAARCHLEMESKYGKKCYRSTVCTAALNRHNPWFSSEPRGGGGHGLMLGVGLDSEVRVKAGDGGKEPKSGMAW
jgi:hypothetical protein